MPVDESELPGTLQRSSAKAQRTYLQTLRSAHREYGSESRADRTAYAALKHGFEKVGDRWEPKKKRGPSDPQARQGGCRARDQPKRTFGGVDVEGHTKAALYERAKKLDVADRSRMSKEELADAIARRQ
jgi:hypothetical protein